MVEFPTSFSQQTGQRVAKRAHRKAVGLSIRSCVVVGGSGFGDCYIQHTCVS